MLKIRIIIGLISLFLLIVIFEAIRRRKFMEKYALLWISAGLVIFILSLFPHILFKLSEILGLYYLTTLLLICFIFLLLILLYLSISISSLAEKNKELAQWVGILKEELDRFKKQFKDEKDKTD
ncbi:MAG: DUF2304 domain-containing protein [Candidatus Omnitrophica bacterium]|nr:DUF2304 domain-containing protein [Candidatus Omnitrophota bacterium]